MILVYRQRSISSLKSAHRYYFFLQGTELRIYSRIVYDQVHLKSKPHNASQIAETSDQLVDLPVDDQTVPEEKLRLTGCEIVPLCNPRKDQYLLKLIVPLSNLLLTAAKPSKSSNSKERPQQKMYEIIIKFDNVCTFLLRNFPTDAFDCFGNLFVCCFYTLRITVE